MDATTLGHKISQALIVLDWGHIEGSNYLPNNPNLRRFKQLIHSFTRDNCHMIEWVHML